jgi:polyisoprenoid-binding protein YceI
MTLLKNAALVVGSLLIAASAQANKHAPAKFELDTAHANVEFRVKHLMVSTVKGRFNKFDGAFMYDEKGKKVTDVAINIDVASIDTNNKDRDDHLRKPDFFNVSEFPKMTFTAKEFTAVPGKAFKVKGDLTMHGKTNPVTLDGKFIGKAMNPFTKQPKVGFELTGKLSRKMWGLTYGSLMEAGSIAISDEVILAIDAEADQAKAADAPKAM